jgi:methyltransferase (TIGR00027 family)
MKPHRPSSTAKVIAASTILLEAEGDPRVAPGAAELCELFLSTTASDRVLALCARKRPGRWFLRLLERMTLPGIAAHYWRRKRRIERHCHEAIAEGFQRVLILGAGFDTLGIRLAREFPQIEVAEWDHPATQATKVLAIGRSKMAVPANFHFESSDLTESIRIPIDPDERRTICVMEGLLMYFTEDEVTELLDGLSHHPARELRLVFTFLTKWPDGRSGFRPHSRIIDWWLRWRAEPFGWAIEPGRINEFISPRGFRLLELVLAEDLDSELPPQSVIRGENLVLCGRH